MLGELQLISLKPTVEVQSAVDPHMDPANITGENVLFFLVFAKL